MADEEFIANSQGINAGGDDNNSLRPVRPQSYGSRESQLSNNQISELKEAFKFFDKDGNGNIDIDELQSVLKTLGQDPTQQEVEEMISTVDIDNNGEIDFEEFVQMMENRMFLPSNQTEFQDCFKFFDKNNDGQIDFNELKEVLTSLGEDNITDQDVQDMIDEADLIGDGKVNFEEFIKMMPISYQATIDDNKKKQENRRKWLLLLLFTKFDKDKNGNIDKKESELLMKHFGFESYKEELFELFDTNSNGVLTFDEFAVGVSSMIEALEKKMPWISEIFEIFQSYDPNDTPVNEINLTTKNWNNLIMKYPKEADETRAKQFEKELESKNGTMTFAESMRTLKSLE